MSTKESEIVLLEHGKVSNRISVQSRKPATLGRAVGYFLRALGVEHFSTDKWSFVIKPPISLRNKRSFFAGIALGLQEEVQLLKEHNRLSLETLVQMACLKLLKTEGVAEWMIDGKLPPEWYGSIAQEQQKARVAHRALQDAMTETYTIPNQRIIEERDAMANRVTESQQQLIASMEKQTQAVLQMQQQHSIGNNRAMERMDNLIDSLRSAIQVQQHQLGEKMETDLVKGEITPEEAERMRRQFDKDRDDFNGAMAALRNKLTGLQAEQDASRRDTEQLRTSLIQRQTDLAALEDQLGRQQEELARSNSRSEALQQALVEARAQRSNQDGAAPLAVQRETNSRVEMLERQLQHDKIEREQLAAALNRTNEQFQLKEQQLIAQFKENEAEKLRSITTLKQELESMALQLNDASKNNLIQHSAIKGEAMKELAEIRELLTTKDAQLRALSQEVAASEATLVQLRQQMATTEERMQNELAKVQGSYNASTNENIENRALVARMRAEIEAGVEDIKRLKGSIEVDKQRLQEEAAASKTENHHVIQGAQREIHRLTTEIQKKDEAMKEIAQRVIALQEEMQTRLIGLHNGLQKQGVRQDRMQAAFVDAMQKQHLQQPTPMVAAEAVNLPDVDPSGREPMPVSAAAAAAPPSHPDIIQQIISEIMNSSLPAQAKTQLVEYVKGLNPQTIEDARKDIKETTSKMISGAISEAYVDMQNKNVQVASWPATRDAICDALIGLNSELAGTELDQSLRQTANMEELTRLVLPLAARGDGGDSSISGAIDRMTTLGSAISSQLDSQTNAVQSKKTNMLSWWAEHMNNDILKQMAASQGDLQLPSYFTEELVDEGIPINTRIKWLITWVHAYRQTPGGKDPDSYADEQVRREILSELSLPGSSIKADAPNIETLGEAALQDLKDYSNKKLRQWEAGMPEDYGDKGKLDYTNPRSIFSSVMNQYGPAQGYKYLENLSNTLQQIDSHYDALKQRIPIEQSQSVPHEVTLAEIPQEGVPAAPPTEATVIQPIDDPTAIATTTTTEIERQLPPKSRRKNSRAEIKYSRGSRQVISGLTPEEALAEGATKVAEHTPPAFYKIRSTSLEDPQDMASRTREESRQRIMDKVRSNLPPIGAETLEEIEGAGLEQGGGGGGGRRGLLGRVMTLNCDPDGIRERTRLYIEKRDGAAKHLGGIVRDETKRRGVVDVLRRLFHHGGALGDPDPLTGSSDPLQVDFFGSLRKLWERQHQLNLIQNNKRFLPPQIMFNGKNLGFYPGFEIKKFIAPKNINVITTGASARFAISDLINKTLNGGVPTKNHTPAITPLAPSTAVPINTPRVRLPSIEPEIENDDLEWDDE